MLSRSHLLSLKLVFLRALTGNIVSRLMKSPKVGEGTQKSTILIYDREQTARDNGEAYFKHLVQKYPSHATFFAVRAGTKCHRRLETEGYKSELVDIFSPRFWRIFSVATVVASSQNTIDTHNRASNLVFGKRERKVVYLKHGVMHIRQENFAKSHSYSLISCASKLEIQELSSQYGETEKSNARQTGMARFDAYSRLSSRDDGTILVAPTWRSNPYRKTKFLAFEQDSYLESWSNAFAQLAKLPGPKKLIKHPLLSGELILRAKQNNFEVFAYEDLDFQAELSKSSCLVSDYSSVLLEALFCGKPFLIFRDRLDTSFFSGHMDRGNEFDMLKEAGAHICADVACLIRHFSLAERHPPTPTHWLELRARIFEGYPRSSAESLDSALGLIS